ncbi:MAG: PspC domain-containing protein [Solirubrobacteraceae bacterium]|nr:PspC domain-containing protein [Solirubrobacteraceae bacterium]
MDTAHTQPDAPQPLGATLRRRSDDRILLGLCSGLARSAGISPLALRLATLLSAFLLLPFLLVAYVVTAVIVPRDDGAALVGTGWRDRRDVWIALALTLIAAPSALSLGSGDDPFPTGHFGFVIVPLFALGILAFLAVRRDREQGSASMFSSHDAGATTPAAGAVAPAQPSETTSVQPTVGDAPTTATTAFAAGDTAATTVFGPSAPATTPDAAGAAPAGGSTPPPPNEPPTFVRGTTVPPQGPKRPGLTMPVLGAVAMVPAIFAILLAGGAVDAEASSWSVMLAVMAVVSAAGAVTIAILRPSYLGAGLLVLLAAALGISSIGVGQFGGVIDDGIGEREFRVSTPTELRDPFILGVGQMDIDLRPLELQPGQRVTVHARLGFGELNVAVPRGARILTTAPSNASALAVTARENGAADSASASAPVIVLDLRGRGINARVLSGRDRDVSQLNVLAETDLGFWSGGRRDEPFTEGVPGGSPDDPRVVR